MGLPWLNVLCYKCYFIITIIIITIIIIFVIIISYLLLL